MKPYGIPRVPETICPDIEDIKKFGFATPDRCSRKDRGKTSSRRIWKKKERARAKNELWRFLYKEEYV